MLEKESLLVLFLRNVKVRVMVRVFCGGRRVKLGVSRGINEEVRFLWFGGGFLDGN